MLRGIAGFMALGGGGGYTFTLLVFNDMHEFMNGDVRSFMSDDDE